MAAKKRNPEIDLWRFIFTVIIFVFHSNHLDDRINFLPQGFVVVEFFFFTSGYLMALSAEKKYRNQSISQSTLKFLKGKVSVFYPYLLLTFIAAFAAIEITSKRTVANAFGDLVLSFQDLGLFKMAGIYGLKYFNGPSWYLSAMLFAMLITFPLLLKFKDNFIYIIAPITCLAGFAIISHENGSLNVNTQWATVTTLGSIRAMAGICAGCLGYGIVRLIKEKNIVLTKFGSVCVIIVELLMLNGILYIMQNRINLEMDYAFDYLEIFLIFVIATLAFSDLSGVSKILNSKICTFLGEISLPLYLVSHPIIDLYLGLNLHWRIRYILIFYAVGSAVGALALYFTVKICRKYKLGTKFARFFVKSKSE